MHGNGRLHPGIQFVAYPLGIETAFVAGERPAA
jgi:hypothetical protein